MRRKATLRTASAFALALALSAGAGCGRSTDQSPETRTSALTSLAFTEFPVPSGASPFAITAGPDGNLWFTERNNNTRKIGKITVTGTVTEYTVPTVLGMPYKIAAGPDGNVWFTEIAGNKIGRITPGGVVTEFSIPTADTSPHGIVAGRDGALWFTEGRQGGVGRITTSGSITAFPPRNGPAMGIAVGADGNLWFAETAIRRIARMTIGGVATEFSLPSGSWVGDMTAGGDGNVWFTDSTLGKVGRITPAGVITEFASPSGKVHLDGIALGPDGNVWFADDTQLFRITPAGVITGYALPANTLVQGITAGPDGNLWYTNDNKKIVRVTLTDPANKVTPLASCIIPHTGSNPPAFTAVFGYRNTGTENAQLVPGTSENAVSGAQPDQGQPRWFAPGTNGAAFVLQKATGPISWTLGKTAAQLTSSSPVCSQVATSEGIAIVVGGVQYPYLTDVGKVAGDKIVASGHDGLSAVPGELTVTPDGAASYSISLWVPPGRLVQPSLSLSYNSRQGNGLVGVGWSLGGLSRITRCPKTLRTSTAARAVQFDRDDLYCLDGNPLVLVSGTYGVTAEYRTQDNITAKIVSAADAATTTEPRQMGPQTFVVYSKGGRISTYQRTDALGLPLTRNGQPANHAWLLSRVEDRFKNAMTVRYRPREAGSDPAMLEILPDAIFYTSNSATGDLPQRTVQFKYGPAANPDVPMTRPDPVEQYVAGVRLLTSKRLTEIRMLGPNPVNQGLLRRYALVYGDQLGHTTITRRSLLETITECDGQNLCRPPATFTWEPGSMDFEDGVAMTGVSDVQYGFSVVDADNDGRNDLVYRVNDSDGRHGHWKYRRRQPDGSFAAPVNLFDYPRSDGANPSWDSFDEPDLAVMDLNGDGQAEGVRRQLVNGGPLYTLNYRTLTTGATGATAPMEFDAPIGYGDMNGDGLPDIITVDPYIHYHPDLETDVQEIGWWARLGQRDLTAMFAGDKWSLFDSHIYRATGNNFWVDRAGAVVADVDGDGVQELLVETGGATKVVSLFRSSDVSIAYGSRDDVRADLNGDGLRDVVAWSPTPTPELLIHTNAGGYYKETARVPSGSGNTALQVYPANRGALSTNAQDLGVRATDFDGDGRQDLVVVGRNDFSSDSRANIWVLRSTPSGLEAFSPQRRSGGGVPMGHFYRDCSAFTVPSCTPTSPGLRKVHGMRGSQLADFDGDGLDDLVQLEGTHPGALTMMLYKRRGKRPDVITSVKNGLGRTTDVTYAHIAQPGAPYSGAGNCGMTAGVFQRCVQAGLWVVSNVRRDRALPADEQTTTLHEYRDAVLDLVPGGRGVFFRTHTVTNGDTGEQTVTNYWVGHPSDPGSDRFGYVLAGRPIDSTRTVPGPGGANTIERRVFKPIVLEWGATYRVENQQTDEFFRDGKSGMPAGQWDRQSVTKYTFTNDEFRNLAVQEELTWGSRPAVLLGSVRDETVEFVNNATTWIVGRAKDVTTTIRSSAQDIPIVRKRTFVIDPTDGRLQSETSMSGAGADFELTTAFTYNSLGRVRTVTATPAGSFWPQSRTASTEYDEREGIFVRRSINALGQTTEGIHHPGLGLLVWSKDLAGAITRSSYDSFGRPTISQPPGAGKTTFDYQSSQDPARAAYRVVTTVTGGSRSVVHYDRLNREVSRSVFNTHNAWTTHNRTYDKRGRLATEQLPTEETFPGSGQLTPLGMTLPKGKTTYVYDERGRILTATQPDGFSIGTSYGDRVRTVTDRRGSKTYTLFDDLGRTVETGLGDGVARRANRMTFAYGQNATGPFSTAADSQGHTMLSQADVAGRTVLSTDPDRGQETARYNAFGEVRDQVVPGSTVPIVWSRDPLGRVTSRTDSDGTTSFLWDAAANGLGQIARTTSPDGTQISETYDTLGRAVTDTYVINGETFTVSRTLDPALGRLTRLVYPAIPGTSGSPVQTAVNYKYSSLTGALTSLTDDGSRLYYQVDTRDILGRRTAESFGNGLKSARTYNPITGRLEHLDTRPTPTAAALNAFHYGYDGNGNLTSREDQTDPTRPKRETFVHDEENRLTAWTRPNTTGFDWQVTYALDASGNLTDRGVFSASGLVEHVRYVYNPTASTRPHAVRAMQTLVPSASPNDGTFDYDPRGNQVSRPGLDSIHYTVFGLPRTIFKGTLATRFRYDAGGTRVWKGRGGIIDGSSDTSTTYVGGLYEKRKTTSTGITHVFHVTTGSQVVAQIVRKGVNPATAINTYFHQDHLGSVTTTTTQAAAVQSRVSFDPFGNRYDPASQPILRNAIPSGGTDVTQGFTGHEMDDDFGLVNMRGRIYDPRTARFLTPDPLVGNPQSPQSYNRYAYVNNNPLTYTDPSGYNADPASSSECHPVQGWTPHEECNTNVAIPSDNMATQPLEWANYRAEEAEREAEAARAHWRMLDAEWLAAQDDADEELPDFEDDADSAGYDQGGHAQNCSNGICRGENTPGAARTDHSTQGGLSPGPQCGPGPCGTHPPRPDKVTVFGFQTESRAQLGFGLDVATGVAFDTKGNMAPFVSVMFLWGLDLTIAGGGGAFVGRAEGGVTGLAGPFGVAGLDLQVISVVGTFSETSWTAGAGVGGPISVGEMGGAGYTWMPLGAWNGSDSGNLAPFIEPLPPQL